MRQNRFFDIVISSKEDNDQELYLKLDFDYASTFAINTDEEFNYFTEDKRLKGSFKAEGSQGKRISYAKYFSVSNDFEFQEWLKIHMKANEGDKIRLTFVTENEIKLEFQRFVFSVSDEEVNQCFSFAEDLYAKQAASLKQFGRTEIIRKKNDYVADHVIGKVIEFGFRNFLLHHFNIGFKVDLEVWEDQYTHDEGNDLATIFVDGEEKSFEFKTDIKGSRKKSLWLIIEDHKINNFHTKIYVTGVLNNMPDGKEFEENPYKFQDYSWTVAIKGYALNKDIIDSSTRRGWIEYKAGDRLYSPYVLKKLKAHHGTSTYQEFQKILGNCVNSALRNQLYIGPKLDCRLNMGLPISWLKNSKEDWRTFANIIVTYSKFDETKIEDSLWV
jgi:hypothetical protein